MPALAWVPVTDAAARRLGAMAKAEGIPIEELAGRAIAQYTGTPEARRIIRKQATKDKREDVHSLLEKLRGQIERHWKQRPGNRTGTENIVVASIALMDEVNNGGFDQFFRNAPQWAAFAPDAMLHIGRKDAARIAKEAWRCVGSLRSPDEFRQKMSRPDDRRDDSLNECDVAFFQLNGLPESILAYARKHPDGLLRR